MRIAEAEEVWWEREREKHVLYLYCHSFDVVSDTREFVVSIKVVAFHSCHAHERFGPCINAIMMVPNTEFEHMHESSCCCCGWSGCWSGKPMAVMRHGLRIHAIASSNPPPCARTTHADTLTKRKYAWQTGAKRFAALLNILFISEKYYALLILLFVCNLPCAWSIIPSKMMAMHMYLIQWSVIVNLLLDSHILNRHTLSH